MNARPVRVQLRLSLKLLQDIDRAAKANFSSRSGFIRESVVLRLNEQHLASNAQGDEGDNALELLKNTE